MVSLRTRLNQAARYPDYVVSRRRRRRSLKNHFTEFVRPGNLVFDVGAHAGDYSDVFLDLGAHVVAFEPQPQVGNRLERRFRGRSEFRLVAKGLADSAGMREMSIGSVETLSTMSSEWLNDVSGPGAVFEEFTWDETVEVPVTTLDLAFEEFGVPDFVKIDVEGYERAVLEGMSRTVPFLSFEFVGERPQAALDCVDRLSEIGFARFNYVDESVSPTFASPSWVDRDSLVRSCLTDCNRRAAGDIYARA